MAKETKNEAAQLIKRIVADRKRQDGLLSNTAKYIAQNKGFKNWHLFSAEFVSCETVVVLFAEQGRLAYLTLPDFETMTKEQTQDKLLPYLTPENRQKLIV